MLVPGTVFGRYRVEALIGEGGMGQVYRAHDTVLRRAIALKVIRPDKDAPEAAARLLREARAAAALNHPNAVAVFDVGEVDDRPFIAMELVDGRPLRAYVRDPSIDIETKIRWLAAVARALDAAHARGLVHRDIKPENVVICENGTTKVLDFGIARPAERQPATPPVEVIDVPSSFRTIDDTIHGTPAYMAPEYVATGVFDARSDQYSWGIMAYELFASVRPLKHPATPLLLHEVCEAVPFEIASIVMRAIAPSAEQRFTDMGEVARALEPQSTTTTRRTMIRPKVVEDSAPTLVDAPRPGKKRPALPYGLGAALGLAVIGGTTLSIVGTHGPAPATSAIASATPSPQPTRVIDLPDPPTANHEALVAYRAAMAAFRDGIGDMRTPFLRVLAIDPRVAAAHFRLAYQIYWDDPQGSREHFARATELSADLTERDRALMVALGARLVDQPSNLHEMRRRLEELLKRYPLDAELWYYYSVSTGMFRGDIEAVRRATEIDPGFARAFWQLGQRAAYVGKLDDARDAFGKCLAVSRAATNCLWNRIMIDETLGHCDSVVADAREWTSVDPHDPLGFQTLAIGLYGRGEAIDAVLEAQQHGEALMGDTERARATAIDAMDVDTLRGDFVRARSRAEEYDRLVTGSSDEPLHIPSAREIVKSYRESGDDARAAAYAESYLKKRAAWFAPPHGEDFDLAADVTLLMDRTVFDAGKIDAATFASRRAAWIADWTKRMDGEGLQYVWLNGEARDVETREDATKALADLGTSAIPSYVPETVAMAWVGHTYFLAGRVQDALPYLALGASSCRALEDPFEQTRAHDWYAQALEANEDPDAACDEYRIVLGRWGDAKPRSVTADHARARSAALHCGNDQLKNKSP